MTEATSKAKGSRSKQATAQAKKPAETKTAEVAPVLTETSKPIIPKNIDPDQIITVRNGFQGKLVYKSRKTGQSWVWDAFGSEQDMELSELKNARNSNKKYFIKNWFMFDEGWVVDYLGMRQFYKNILPVQEFDSLFEKDADEVREIVSKLSEGQRKSVAYRARQLISEGGIDSNRVIAALEECLGVELIER